MVDILTQVYYNKIVKRTSKSG